MNEKITAKTLRFSTLDSTNDYAKSLRGNGDNLFVVAERQTGGRGTKGRSFSSEKGGVYLSLLRYYRNFPASEAFLVMERAAVAVCKTLEAFGLAPKIKWANDVLVNGKKICGILIENVFSGNQIKNSVIGVGLNVNNFLPSELDGLATTMKSELGKAMDVAEVEKRLKENLLLPFDKDEYQKRLGFMGERITLVTGDERVPATALSVNDRGELVVETDVGVRVVSVGEASLRRG